MRTRWVSQAELKPIKDAMSNCVLDAMMMNNMFGGPQHRRYHEAVKSATSTFYRAYDGETSLMPALETAENELTEAMDALMELSGPVIRSANTDGELIIYITNVYTRVQIALEMVQDFREQYS